ncbi:nucleoside hydrolase [Microvirga soli]|uniref:nucleoside hydrolase n=1 Tax=Microvirga soli TaxID=1854496 RepID=UPI00191EF146|nr:nucleoside hydrolase [Microvirga soli]
MNLAKPRLTVIDTDPGIDDAIGILLALASPSFTIAGITTVAGNIGIETTTRNAGRLLAFAGREDIPVFQGASAPLSRVGPEPLNLHGEDGIGGVALPDPARLPENRHAVEWLADFLMGQPAGAVDVLALGPLTNLARLVLEKPEAARRIGRIIGMGGAIHEHGNVGPRSEFNLWADPEAAAVVVASGLPFVLIPLDVTRRVRATREFVEALSSSGKPTAAMVASLIESYFEAATNRESRPLHDLCVMLFALSPELFECEDLQLSVSVARNEQAGELTIMTEGGAMVRVAMRVDAPAVLELLTRQLTAD